MHYLTTVSQHKCQNDNQWYNYYYQFKHLFSSFLCWCKGQQIMVMCWLLFLSIKFCWNTCMLMHFHIVFGCVLTALSELSRYKRDCTAPKPKILTICPSKKKFADPCPKQDCSMKVILTFGPDDSLLWRGILCIVECSGAFLVSSYYHRCL